MNLYPEAPRFVVENPRELWHTGDSVIGGAPGATPAALWLPGKRRVGRRARHSIC